MFRRAYNPLCRVNPGPWHHGTGRHSSIQVRLCGVVVVFSQLCPSFNHFNLSTLHIDRVQDSYLVGLAIVHAFPSRLKSRFLEMCINCIMFCLVPSYQTSILLFGVKFVETTVIIFATFSRAESRGADLPRVISGNFRMDLFVTSCTSLSILATNVSKPSAMTASGYASKAPEARTTIPKPILGSKGH
jgi:hypothetical protein